ncbi:hypothetical protein BURMUCGD1_2592 [Burkholderia multivorans CGD1]|nr:hypothetical protein BURMUCGD1_2592 [Burkholderia multivorans CGD1]
MGFTDDCGSASDLFRNGFCDRRHASNAPAHAATGFEDAGVYQSVSDAPI